MESLSAPTWELFDDCQVAVVLEQCQVNNMNSASQELLIAVPILHKILAVELSTIQGSAAMNQRVMIQSILLYSMQFVGTVSRRSLVLLKQAADTTTAPQSLLNKVSGVNPVAWVDGLAGKVQHGRHETRP